ncbi:5-formyltetrahydrofolate cyclo-ligase [Sphingopyxis lindanitolerans]|uniref:5-formyltetrahydrofolate cyclo-ligase n=1 Tax=Sphingopyxis lindanitolerans TaxID=2054227 RepID=A0A2S8BAJ7_9SPHN|nr:5-formyltetrahydrofolate cyclo-ligase [Sphingopyxis lindanitolerans]PQM29444.1 5-formyltetrahydrofolate cyclo-ligase [Sphingopyxis lindanitolerans]
MLSDSLAQRKQKLRDKLRFRRRHFVANLGDMARLGAFRALPAPLADLVAASNPVAAYAAWDSEPDILPMLTCVILTLPYHEGRIETMDFRRWRAGEPLVKGPWGTPQPADDTDRLLPGLIFCPLVGFDRQGGRLGQGGGHYDRFFAAHPGLIRIGVAWSVQEVDTVPIEPTDVRLDAVLTEQEYIMTGDRL